jgi:2-desacetyl-2-hydroxyethyl bacteriochlorophyllide A dehydrogenase
MAPDDAIIAVSACALCGSDLHIYHGHGFSGDTGFCVGHEAVGEVVEIGRGVRGLRTGDRVMLSAAVGCGVCASCLAGDVVRCATGAGACYGLSNALQGCQAEFVRVPAAHANARRIPEGVSEEQALMLTDSLATAWYGARMADIPPGADVAILGLGAIGQMTVEIAYLTGAARVFAIDPVAERRAIAVSSGAIAIAPEEAEGVIREATRGQMCAAVIEAVGHGTTIRAALRLCGRRATLSVIGVAQDQRFDLPIRKAFASGLTFRIGTCSPPEEWPALIPLVRSGRLRPERYITHRFPLSRGEEAYRLFDSRSDGVMKAVLRP